MIHRICEFKITICIALTWLENVTYNRDELCAYYYELCGTIYVPTITNYMGRIMCQLLRI